MINLLLTTYNGERYLPALLDSLIAQTEDGWTLYVHDDGSTDSTNSILDGYATRLGEKLVMKGSDRLHLGAKDAFELLLRESPAADYYMFVDQDDVWLPDKIAVTLSAMKEAEAEALGKPVVVHTDLVVVDENLQTISPSFWQYSNLRPRLIEGDIHYLAIANCLTGCTMMLNHVARETVLPFAANAYMHDQWIGLCTMMNGGTIVPVTQQTILYRQHSANTLGAKQYRFSLTEPSYKLFLARRSYHAAHPQVFRNPLHFIYWKLRYFLKLHLTSNSEAV